MLSENQKLFKKREGEINYFILPGNLDCQITVITEGGMYDEKKAEKAGIVGR